MLGQNITLELNIDMREGGSVREASNINKRPPKLLTTPVTFPPPPPLLGLEILMAGWYWSDGRALVQMVAMVW